MRLFRGKGIDPEARETFQPRLWLIVVALVLIAAYVVAFIAENNKKVTVHFVFWSAHTSVIWVVLFTLVIGLVSGLLVSQLVRRRSRRERR